MLADNKVLEPFRTEWINALRSDIYPQTCGKLRRDGLTTAYCCLGVGCEVAIKTGLIKLERSSGGYRNEAGYESTIFLPDDLAETVFAAKMNSFFITREMFDWLNERSPEDVIALVHVRPRSLASFVTLNDSLHLTFPQIADFIETFL